MSKIIVIGHILFKLLYKMLSHVFGDNSTVIAEPSLSGRRELWN